MKTVALVTRLRVDPELKKSEMPFFMNVYSQKMARSEKAFNKLFQYSPAPSVPPSDGLDAASPQAAAEQGRYLF